MIHDLFPRGALAVALVALFAAGEVWSQELKPQADDAADEMKIKKWYAFYQREAEDVYRFTLDPIDQELELDKTPVMRWTNPLEEGNIHGVMYIWRDKGRPVVLGQMFSYLNGKGGRVYCHAMHSLARPGEGLIGRRNGNPFWKPDSPGVEMRLVPMTPTPATNRAGRLAQMKAISRRITAYTEEKERGKRFLRLLPTPLDRYPEKAENQTDGAIFSYVVGNDPEVILVLENVPMNDSEPVWRFGFCRSTRSSCTALLDDVETWHYDSTDVNPADSTNRYLSQHGIATLPLDAPN